VKNRKSIVTLTVLAKALGVDAGQMSREAARPGFPVHLVKGDRRYDVDEVRDWRRRNVGPRPRSRKTVNGAMNAAASGAAGVPVAEADDPFVKILLSGTASGLELTRAAAQLVSRRLARAEVSGTMSLGEVDGFKKCLGELRNAESDYLAVAEEQGRMIDRDVVKGIVGAACARLVKVCERLETDLATDFLVWRSDAGFSMIPADEQARKVRARVRLICDTARTQEADAVEKLIEEARKEFAGD